MTSTNENWRELSAVKQAMTILNFDRETAIKFAKMNDDFLSGEITRAEYSRRTAEFLATPKGA